METANRRGNEETTAAACAPSAATALAAAPPVEHAWLTVETAAYAVILLAALAVRLAALGRWPLLSDEVNTALATWRGVKGVAWRPAYYVPLLYDAQLLLFGLTRATDAAARLLPALVGAALTLLPYGVRDLLGRKGALCAALLLAFAPSWVYMSRTADGAILATACGAALLLAAYRYAREGRPRDLTLGALALGVGLTAGPQFYTYVFLAAAYGFVLWLRARAQAVARDASSWAWPTWAQGRGPALIALGAFIFLASGYLTNLGGVGASAGLLGRWLESLAPGYSGLAWSAYPRLLWGYEFLTLALALASVGWGIRERDEVDLLLMAWVGAVLVLGMALGHRAPAWVLDALLPLLILAARGAQRLYDTLVVGAGRADLLAVLGALPFVVFAFLQIASYTQAGQEPFLHYALITGGILLLAWGAYWIWGPPRAALRAGAGVLLLVMLAFTTRVTTAVAYQTGRDPREGLVYQPVSVQMRDFSAQVAETSSRQAGDPLMLEISYDASLDPWLAWYLRDYTRARTASIDFGAPPKMALVTPLLDKAAWPSNYAGQRYRLFETFPAQTLTRRERLLWNIYREPVGMLESTEIVFWVRLPVE